MIAEAGQAAADVNGAKAGIGLKLTGPGVLEVVREVMAIAGTVRARAAGGSMWPTIRDGSVVTLIPLETKVQPGQVVLMDWGGLPVLHRVLKIDRDLVHTIGDACVDPDLPTQLADVVALATTVSDDRGVITLTGSWRHGIRSLTLYISGRWRLALARRWRRLRRLYDTQPRRPVKHDTWKSEGRLDDASSPRTR